MARLVSLSRPDGGMESEVVWINRTDQERLDAAELMERYPDEGELKGVLAA